MAIGPKVLVKFHDDMGTAIFVSHQPLTPGRFVSASRVWGSPKLKTPHPKPQTLNPKTYTLNPITYTLNPKTYTLNLKTFTLNPETYTLNPKTYTLNPKPKTEARGAAYSWVILLFCVKACFVSGLRDQALGPHPCRLVLRKRSHQYAWSKGLGFRV